MKAIIFKIKTINFQVFLFSLLALLCISSCKNEETFGVNDPEILRLIKHEENKDSLQVLIGTIYAMLKKEGQGDEANVLVKMGYHLSQKHSLTNESTVFGYELLKCCNDNENAPQVIGMLRTNMIKTGRTEVAMVLAQALKTYHQNSAEAKALKEEDYNMVTKEWITKMGAMAFDSTGKALVEAPARKYIDLCEAYGLTHDKDQSTSRLLFSGAEMARSLNDYEKALLLYQMLYQKYPNAEEAALATFFAGFIIENNFRDKENAKLIYESFLTKYPNHQRAQDVKFLLDNLFLTEEELIKKFEAKKQTN